jgi:hypothetical protein
MPVLGLGVVAAALCEANLGSACHVPPKGGQARPTAQTAGRGMEMHEGK